MARQHRVVWFEGMTLDPHHFQQQDRFARMVVDARVRAAHPFPWGISDLDIDRDALANGVFLLRRCAGVMRDGVVFEIPGNDMLPPERDLQPHFPPTAESLGVFLALPAERTGGRNCQLDGDATDKATRFVMETIPAIDENTGGNERSIGVGRPNFSVVFATEPREELTTLQIAEVVRSANNTFALSTSFIPSALTITASENMGNLSRRLLELLVAKSNALADRRRQQPSGQVEFTSADITVFWLLHTMNTFIPLLHHHQTTGRSHPEALYTSLLSLAGQLSTFSTDTDFRPRDLPPYDHDKLTDCFRSIDQRIRHLLDTVISSNFVTVPLERRSDALWVGKVTDDRLFKSAQFVMTTSGDKPDRAVVDELPRKVKIAAPDIVNQLIVAARPGLTVSHAPVPPPGLPSRPGVLYFRLEKGGALWDGITSSGSLGIFMPAEFKSLEVKLYAVRED